MQSGIYIIENHKNGKVYVGQSRNINSRKYHHFHTLNNGTHCNRYLQRAFNKDGAENFTFSVIEECPIENLDERERYWIAHYDSMNAEHGYNAESGGNVGKEISERVREAKLGKNNPMYGKHLSQEHREMIRQQNRGTHSTLNEQIVADIKRDLYARMSNKDVAEKYNVKQSTVGKIKSCDNWAWVLPELNLSEISTEDREARDAKIHELEQLGYPRSRIAKEVGCLPATVTRVLGTGGFDKAHELKAQVVEAFKQGMSKEEIMQKFNIQSNKYVSYTHEAYVEKCEATRQKAIDLRKSGMMVKDIAKQLGFARTTISKWTKDLVM